MKLGLELGTYSWEGGPERIGTTLAEIGRTADHAGFAVIGAADHLWQGAHAGGPEQPMLECLTTLAALAAHTERIPLMTGVAGVHFRHPAMLAKAVTTLDVISGGRAVLGIGVGWDADECAGNGIPFPPVGQRFAMLEETLRVCLAFWEGEQGSDGPVEGEHYRLGRVLNLPQSLSRPHPPILIGGGGEKRTLRLVAQYADACNLHPTPDVPHKLDVLRQHCADVGRDYDSIEKTIIMPIPPDLDGNADAMVDMLHGMAESGVDTAIGILADPTPVHTVNVLADKVLPAIADAG
ncbi:MAG TPA: LLM class F420-dependent oxidoreductase [Actinophytocola sp.]|uniref:LLM class F420-dependent oxidoreductase n=1 Tax=Actinophytocola sp. TaxID=1872138 RepID=UPI002DDD0346|nr:LLM class F420-dependent oxidoreductase [Actinophytocola sp.]HEV2780618.1 LLM class F420-dependent oxidoreductase [Actinophytocola sp.]